MKQLLIIFLLSISTFATAQSSRLKTRISDDSQTLSIQIDGFKSGRAIHYNRSFDVTGMTAFQKNVLTFRAFASQNVMPPLHDMLVSIAAILGVITLISTFLIVGYRSRKAALTQKAGLTVIV